MGAEGEITMTNLKTGHSESFDNYTAGTLSECTGLKTGQFPVILAKFWRDYVFGSGYQRTASVSAPTYDLLEGNHFVCPKRVNSSCTDSSDGENSDNDDSAYSSCRVKRWKFL